MSNRQVNELRPVSEELVGARKPTGEGRLWRRMATRVVPRVLREPLEKNLGETAGSMVGLVLAGGMAAVIPLAIGGAILSLGSSLIGHLVETAPASTGLPIVIAQKVAESMHAIVSGVMAIGLATLGIKILFRGD
jgi:hypothetical protein